MATVPTPGASEQTSRGIESRPDQCTDIEMTESLTPTCGLSGGSHDWRPAGYLATPIAQLSRLHQGSERHRDTEMRPPLRARRTPRRNQRKDNARMTKALDRAARWLVAWTRDNVGASAVAALIGVAVARHPALILLPAVALASWALADSTARRGLLQRRMRPGAAAPSAVP